MKKRIKIQGFLIFSAAMLSFLLAKFLSRPVYDGAWGKVLDTIGVDIFLSGFLFRIAARDYKAKTSLESKRLVAGGPYALVRNPMYLGTFLIGAGIILILFAWWVFFLFLAIFLAIYLLQVRREETILRKRFGAEYAEYCKNVPRFLPKLIGLGEINLLKCLYFKWSGLKKELPSLLGSAIFIILIKIRAAYADLGFFIFILVAFMAVAAVLFYGKENFTEES